MRICTELKQALTDLTLQTHHDVGWMVLCLFGGSLNQPPAQKLYAVDSKRTHIIHFPCRDAPSFEHASRLCTTALNV